MLEPKPKDPGSETVAPKKPAGKKPGKKK